MLTVKLLIKHMLMATRHPTALQLMLWKSPLHAQQENAHVFTALQLAKHFSVYVTQMVI